MSGPTPRAPARELGVDPRAIVAQAALETGWGRKVTRDSRGVSGNNLFNIKADSRWSGERVSRAHAGVPRMVYLSSRWPPSAPTRT